MNATSGRTAAEYSQGGIKNAFLISLLALLLGFGLARAVDEVEMRNGDRYLGQVLALSTNALVFKSDMLGKVTLPRKEVRAIHLHEPKSVSESASKTNVVTNTAPILAANPGVAGALGQLRSTKDVSQYTPNDLLSQAGPEAQAKFQSMVGGLMTGRMSIEDLRTEAKSVADQVRALRADLGEDAGWALDSYLAILDNFINEAAPKGKPATPGSPTRP